MPSFATNTAAATYARRALIGVVLGALLACASTVVALGSKVGKQLPAGGFAPLTGTARTAPTVGPPRWR